MNGANNGEIYKLSSASNFFSFSYSERIVGYYPYWIQNTLLPQDIDLGTYTHINHAFVWPNTNGDIIAPSNSFFSNSAASYIHDQNRKFILSLGGGGQSQGFASATSTYEIRSTLLTIFLKKLFHLIMMELILIGSILNLQSKGVILPNLFKN